MRIFVDGDGCPVKDVIVAVAGEFQLQVVIVTSIEHFTTKDYPKYVSFVYVDHGKDAADFKIISLINAGDLLVTQDYGLASLVLPKKCTVLNQLGFEYTSTNIDQLLSQRYIHGKLREKGVRLSNPKAFTEQERHYFEAQLVKVLSGQC